MAKHFDSLDEAQLGEPSVEDPVILFELRRTRDYWLPYILFGTLRALPTLR